MIYTRFHGRMGNQLFQFAAGRALALRRGTDLVIDDRLAQHKGEGTLREVFDLPHRPVNHLPPTKHENPVAYAKWRYWTRKPNYLREAGLAFDASVLDAPDDTYLHGYWQSEAYFADAVDQIRADIQFKTPIGRTADLVKQIPNELSVSLHVRRGDYVGNASHAICDQAYYDAALAALMPELAQDPTLYVFSDEPDWARNNLTLPGRVVVVDHNADYPEDDLRLMSLCRHNIIANSSFSWWGAWLNQSPERIVLAPKQWFGKPGLSNPDILPKDWRQVA